MQVGKEPDKVAITKPATPWLTGESWETVASDASQLRAWGLRYSCPHP